MTVEQRFGHDTSEVSEANFEVVFGGLHEGVLAGIDNECRVVESAPAAMTVEVMTGTFVTGGVFASVTAQEVITIGVAPGAGFHRIDRIVCRRNNATNLVTVYCLAGTPVAVAGPASPTALTRVGGVWEISLAQVYVGPAVAAINPEDIADERESTAFCGYSSGRSQEQLARDDIERMRQWGEWGAYGDAALLIGILLWENLTIAHNASVASITSDGSSLRQDTVAAAGADAYTHTVLIHRREYNTLAEFKIQLSSVADIRLFVGLTTVFGATPVGADDFAGHHAGVQFSTDRGDTTWQFMTKDGAVQDLVDSEVIVDTNAVFIRVTCLENGTDVLLEIFDANHDILASIVTAVRVPGAAQNLCAYSGLESRAVAVKSIYQYYARGISRGV